MFRFYSKADETKNRVSVVGECTDGTLKIAVSRCSSKDNFVRKKGRELAETRLKTGNVYFQVQANTCDVREFLYLAKSIAKEVSESAETLKKFIKK